MVTSAPQTEGPNVIGRVISQAEAPLKVTCPCKTHKVKICAQKRQGGGSSLVKFGLESLVQKECRGKGWRSDEQEKEALAGKDSGAQKELAGFACLARK